MALDQLVFVRRRSPDWERLASEHEAGVAVDPSRYERVDAPGFPPDAGARVHLWNKAFPINFFRCRHVLKEISERSVRQVANGVLISEDQLDELPAIVAGSQSLVFFFDDDDLFAPETFELLSNIELGECDVAVFPLAHVGEYVYTFVRECSPRTVLVGSAQEFRYRFHTNNYGLTSTLALTEHLTHMRDHVLASAYANRHRLSDAYIDVLIGATNKTPCSAVVLRELAPHEDAYRAAVDRYLERLGRLELPREARWLTTPLDDTMRLFAAVSVQTVGGR